MMDLFKQCTYVRMCLSSSGMSICAHVHICEVMRTAVGSRLLTHEDTGRANMPSLAVGLGTRPSKNQKESLVN